MLLVLGVVLSLAGAVWVAQGLNLPFAPGSFMTSEPTWVVIGAVTLVIGLLLVVRDLRGRLAQRRPPPDGH